MLSAKMQLACVLNLLFGCISLKQFSWLETFLMYSSSANSYTSQLKHIKTIPDDF